MMDGTLGTCDVINYQDIAKRSFADPGKQEMLSAPGEGGPELRVFLKDGDKLRVEITGVCGIKDKALTLIMPEGLALSKGLGLSGEGMPGCMAQWIALASGASGGGPVVYTLADMLDSINVEAIVSTRDAAADGEARRVQIILDGDSGELPVRSIVDVHGLAELEGGDAAEPETVDLRWGIDKADEADGARADLGYGDYAAFRLDIMNTLNEAGGGFEAYLPVPHRGMNYGSDFQNEPFGWSMALAGPPVGDVDYCHMSYTTDSIYDNNWTEVNFRSASDIAEEDRWADVTVIRVLSVGALVPETTRSLVFAFAAADDRELVVPAEVNEFHPHYIVESPSVCGRRAGEGTTLSYATGVVSGWVWKDKNGDGVFAGDEVGWLNAVVKLRPHGGGDYAIAQTPGVYAGIDAVGAYAWTAANRDGWYKFSGLRIGEKFDVQFVNPDPANMEITGQGIVAGLAEGTVEGIDPADWERARNVSAGMRARRLAVTFDAGDADSWPAAVEVVVTRPTETIAALPQPPERANYAFAGWFDTPDGEGGRRFTQATRVDSSMRVYARWVANKVRVAFSGGSADAGTPPSTRANIDSGSAVSLAWNRKAPPLARAGYVFDGWSETDGGLAAETIVPTANTTVYPVWRKASLCAWRIR